MSVPVQNMRTVMQWLSDPMVSGADAVTEDLARLVFLGDGEWPNYDDRAASYAEAISAWLAGGTESQFIELTAEGGDPAAFIRWMAPVLEQWDAAAAQDEAAPDGQGLLNPNYESDPTPGTQYYKYDEATGTYRYSATADGSDWATYEQRRYSDPTPDDSYGLSYRYDKRDEIYEWYDEQNGTWNDQSWADQYAASRSSQAAAAGAGSQEASAAVWDENWQMFYRLGPTGAYEYADAVVPGDESSGSSEVWLSYEQAMMRAAQEQGAEQAQIAEPEPVRPDQAGQKPGDEETAQPGAVDLSQEQIDTAVNEVLREHPEFADIPEAERQQLISEVLDEIRTS